MTDWRIMFQKNCIGHLVNTSMDDVNMVFLERDELCRNLVRLLN